MKPYEHRIEYLTSVEIIEKYGKFLNDEQKQILLDAANIKVAGEELKQENQIVIIKHDNGIDEIIS